MDAVKIRLLITAHPRPQSRLALLAAGDWVRGPREPLGPRAQSPAVQRAKQLWGRE